MIERVIHIIIGILLFLGSTGIVVNKHYCQNELKSTALFLKAEACHAVTSVASCPMHQHKGDEDREKKNCCDDKSEYVKSDNEQLVQSFEIDFPNHPVSLDNVPLVLNTDPSALDAHSLHYLTYKPPIVLNDIPVLLQAFLL